MEYKWDLSEAIEYYAGQNAPADQNALVELLKEIQDECGGVVPSYALVEVCRSYDIKKTFLDAIIKAYPSIRTEDAPHLLQLCSGERCAKRGCSELVSFVEKTYDVENGKVSATGGFLFKVTGCMKNCTAGPNIKWDGKLYQQADINLLKTLINDCKSTE